MVLGVVGTVAVAEQEVAGIAVVAVVGVDFVLGEVVVLDCHFHQQEVVVGGDFHHQVQLVAVEVVAVGGCLAPEEPGSEEHDGGAVGLVVVVDTVVYYLPRLRQRL